MERNDYFSEDIREEAYFNKEFREIKYTDSNLQLVYMSLLPNEHIGLEIHETATQYVRIEEGHGEALINDLNIPLYKDIVVIIPPNTYHDIINTSQTKHMKLSVIYSPPLH